MINHESAVHMSEGALSDVLPEDVQETLHSEYVVRTDGVESRVLSDEDVARFFLEMQIAARALE